MAEPENQSATAVAFKVSVSSDGSRVTLNWPKIKASQAVIVSRNGAVIANLPGAAISYVDDGASGVDDYVVTVTTASRSASGIITIRKAPVGLAGFYYDTEGHATAQDSEALATFLSTGGKSVLIGATSTYTGGASWESIGSFVPFNSVPPPAGWKCLLAMSMCPDSYTPGSGTLLAGVTANLTSFRQLFTTMRNTMGPGNTVYRLGYEINGNYPGGEVGGAGPWSLFPGADFMAAFSLLAQTMRAIDPDSLVDFNVLGSGPPDQLFQDGLGIAGWCPFADVDILSIDEYYNPGNSDYSVGHVSPWIDIADQNGLSWGVPEWSAGSAAGHAADGALYIEDMVSLIKGMPTLNRQDDVPYSPYEPAAYQSYWSSDDGGATNLLTDSVNAPYAAAYLAGFGV